VSETLSEADHQARYDLGIAYREMGLLGDAMSELQVSMTDPAHRIGSLQLMALCAIDLGEPEQATGYLQDALSTPDLSDECEVSLQLDLGKSYEAAGDVESARTAYQEVQTREPGFADVESRLAELEERAAKDADDSEEHEDDLDAAGTPNTAEYETFDGFLDDLDEDEEDELQTASDAEADSAEPKSWESFDDVIAEAQAEDEESASAAVESHESANAVEVTAEVEVSQSLDPEPEEALEPDADAIVDLEAEDVPASKPRKKKISFV
jgi:tetratricopeptide (TPR) repeat protein